jgi:hypothetical protein
MFFRPSRARRGPDPTLAHRAALFLLGAAAGLAGIALEQSWLVAAGTVLLAVGLVIAVGTHRRSRTRDRDAQ